MPSPVCPSAQFQKKSFFLFTFLKKLKKKTLPCCFSIQPATKYESKDKTHKEFANRDELMRHSIRNFEHSVNFIFQKLSFVHFMMTATHWLLLLPFTRAHNSVVIAINMAEMITLRSQTWFGISDEMKVRRPERLRSRCSVLLDVFNPAALQERRPRTRKRWDFGADIAGWSHDGFTVLITTWWNPLQRNLVWGGERQERISAHATWQIVASRILFISLSSRGEAWVYPIPSPFARGLLWHIANLAIIQFISRLSFYSRTRILRKFPMNTTGNSAARS